MVAYELFSSSLSGKVKFQDVFSSKEKLNANLEAIERELRKQRDDIMNQIKQGGK